MSNAWLIASTALLLAAPAAAELPERIAFTVAPTRATSDKVQLALSYRTAHSESRHSNSIALRNLQGLDAGQLAATGSSPIRFRIVGAAGTLDCDGIARNGRGTGDCGFAPDARYAAALAQRGIARPTADQQFQLTIQGTDFAVVDELIRQGYAKPSVQNLIETGIFGIDAPFLRALDAAGYRAGKVATLVQMKIHGVTPDYIAQLAAIGPAYRQLPIDALVQMRIHDVSPERLRGYAAAGYPNLARGQIVTMAIHGVTPDYIAQMAEAGYRGLTPEQLVNMRIHGVNAEMARVARTAVRQN